MPAFPPSLSLADIAAYGFKIGGGSRLGAAVSSAGDVNGDGYDDFLVGGYGLRAAYLIYGKASGFGPLNLGTLTPADGIRILEEIQGDELGSGTAQSELGNALSAGDVNGDGLDDLILGAGKHDAGGTDAGATYVLFGKASGLGNVSLGALGPADGFKIVGDADGDWAGFSVSSAGDFNQDGYDDILIGAPLQDAGGSSSGAAYLIYGKATGFGTIDLGAIGSNGFRIIGDGQNDRAGFDVSSAGDVNGDGYDDLIVNSLGTSPNGKSRTYVLFGRAEQPASIDLTGLASSDGFVIRSTRGAAAGDFNNDGFDDVIVGNMLIYGKASGFGEVDILTLTPQDGFRFVGEERAATGYSVASAGDVDGDGYDDVLIGAFNASEDRGVAYLVYGRPAGLDTLDLTNLGRADGFQIVGAARGDQAGISVSSAGDVNNDGFDDMLVGAFGADGAAGAAYVIFGQAYATNLAPSGADLARSIWGDTRLIAADFGFSDAEGDGFAGIKITSLPASGVLYFDADGFGNGQPVAVTAGQLITKAALDAGHLTYRAGPGATADGFTFQVQDTGGLKNGGVDLDPTPNTVSFAINAVFDPSQPLPPFDPASPEPVSQEFLEKNGFRVDAGVSRFVGDFNNDGRDDIFLAADPSASLQLGRAAAYGDVIASLPAPDRIAIVGPENRTFITATGGDVNGDGIDDLIVTARLPISSIDNSVYVIFGGADHDGTIDLTTLTPETGFRIADGGVRGRVGKTLATADVNGDGRADILIGAPGLGPPDGGDAYVVFGREAGADVSLATLAPSDGFRLAGTSGFRGEGSDTASRLDAAGDVNGDGYEDFFVFERISPNGSGSFEVTYLVLGKAGGFGTVTLQNLALPGGLQISGFASPAGDVNRDGFSDYFTFSGNDAILNYGGTDVANPLRFVIANAGTAVYAGDFNVDGFVDVATATNILFGDGTAFYAADAVNPRWKGTGFGKGAVSVGDYNGDGYDDLLSGGQLYFGRPSPITGPSILGTAGNDILVGTDGADTIAGLAGDDSLDGRAGLDRALYSGARDDYLITHYGNSLVRISGPEGVDILRNIEFLDFEDGVVAVPRALFEAPVSAIEKFGVAIPAGGWTSYDKYPRTAVDVNGDGRADLVGFGENGIYVSFANADGTFASVVQARTYFGVSDGWTSQDRYPRTFADINGDGRSDLIGFGEFGVYTAFANTPGAGAYWNAPALRLGAFGATAGGWDSYERYPRMVADVNGDGKADIVGFGDGGVQIALSVNGTFFEPFLSLRAFGASAGGWDSYDRYPRDIADVNGDGRMDLIGFGDGGVQIALGIGGGQFDAPYLALSTFGASAAAGGWDSYDKYPRMAADVNGDGAADLLGFGDGGLWVAISNRDGSFADPVLALTNFGAGAAAGGWTSNNLYPRMFADVDGNGTDDLVAFGDNGTIIAAGSEFAFLG